MARRPKILVVGSFVMDQIATTEVFPRQGQTVLGKTFDKAPGGKGANQAVQAARLGAEVTMLGKLGRDANGEALLATCQDANIHTEHVLYDETVPSGCSIIILEQAPDGGTQNRIIVISGSNLTITPEEVAFLEEEIKAYDMVILQLEIPMEINELVAGYARRAHVPVLLNCAPSAPLGDALLRDITILSPNEHEAFDLTGVEIVRQGKDLDMARVQGATGALRERGVEQVLMTLGSSGAVLDDGALTLSPAVPGVTAVDATGAGDSFIGAYAVASCSGLSSADTLKFANYVASITVSRMGAIPSLPYLDEVEAKLVADEVNLPLEKLKGSAER